jgi:hypothetical protein
MSKRDARDCGSYAAREGSDTTTHRCIQAHSCSSSPIAARSGPKGNVCRSHAG